MNIRLNANSVLNTLYIASTTALSYDHPLALNDRSISISSMMLFFNSRPLSV